MAGSVHSRTRAPRSRSTSIRGTVTRICGNGPLLSSGSCVVVASTAVNPSTATRGRPRNLYRKSSHHGSRSACTLRGVATGCEANPGESRRHSLAIRASGGSIPGPNVPRRFAARASRSVYTFTGGVAPLAAARHATRRHLPSCRVSVPVSGGAARSRSRARQPCASRLSRAPSGVGHPASRPAQGPSRAWRCTSRAEASSTCSAAV